MEVLATGHISLVDINDAIVSDVAPADPSLGALWIDTTKDPNTLNSWDGTNWVEQSLSISSLDPSFYQDVEKLKDFADKAGSDGIISSGEKANIKLILMEITGDVLSGQTLPTLTTIDTAKGGQVYLARAEARASGIPITHADYTAFETAYSDLKTYLESLTPRPWLAGDTTIDPITWTAKWDAYYEKLSRLAVATSTYLANSIRPGEDYNGVTINTDKGIVVLRGDNLFRTILNATEGISIEKNNAGTWNKMFYTNLDGKIYAHGLVISSDSTIAGTDAATIKDNAAKGKAGIDELTSDLKVTPVEKAQLSREWEAIKAEYTQVLAQATSLGVTTSTYTTSYTNLDGVTPKIAAEVLATMTTTYTFTSASTRDAFRTKINSYFAESEKIKKAINDAINKSASDANNKITNLQIGGRNLVTEYSDIRTLPPKNNGDAADNYNYERFYVDMELNKEYTVSAKVEFTTQAPNTDTHISIYPYPEGSDTFVPIIDGKVVFTFTKKSANTNSVLMYAGKAGSTRSKGVIFREIQIEQGNKATAYRLAPEAVDKMINSISFGVRNLLDNSQLFGMQSNHATNYPIDVTETLEGNTKFLRVKNSKKGTDTITFSVYNSIRFADIPENLAGKEITVSHKVRASKNVDMTLMALVFKTTGTPDFKFPDYGKIYNITTEWQTVSSTVTLPSDLSQYGGIRYIISSPTTPQPDLYVDYREWKLEYGNRVTDWTPSTGDVDKLIADVDKKAEASKSAIADMTSDMKITPLEKSQLSRDWEAIKAEYPQVLALAQSASGVSTSAYTTAYTNLDGTSPKIASEILANMNTTYAFASAAARDLFKTQMNAYFSESEKIKKAISDAINKSANNANDKIDNLKIGSRNIVRKKQLMAVNAASSSYDEPTNTWTITANDGAGGSWGAGVRITDKLSVVPIGSWFTASFEVYSPVDITWNNDTNNFPIGTSSGSNDNDEVALRKNSGRSIKANTWTKCWFSYKNKDSSTTELYDQSNIGIVNNTGAPITFKIRNVKGELGSIPTDFTFAQEDLDEAIAKISFSGRNLILNSNQDYSTTGYLINQYMLSEDWITGQEYTFVIKGSVPQGQTFGIWQNGGSTNVGYATAVYINGVTYVTFKAAATTSGNERKLSLYNYPSNTTQANVDWVALYKGNKPMDWMIAPEDIETIINLQSSGAANMFRNSGNFRNLNGWILNGGKSLKVGQKDGFTVLEAVGSITSTNHVTREMLKPSTEYVYSVEIMFSKDTNIDNTKPIHHWFFDTGGNYNAVDYYKLISNDTVAKANTWTRVSIVFKTKATITSAAYFKAFVYDNVQLTDDNKYWVKNVMFSETNRIVNWSASLADIEELVANVPFVGRNMFLNSGLIQGAKYWYSNQSQTEIISDGGEYAFKFISNSGLSGGVYQRQGGVSTGSPPFDNDQEYTVTAMMKCSAAGQRLDMGAEGISIGVFNLTTEWKEYSYTFRGTGTGNGTIIFYSKTPPDGTQFFVKRMKLEKGNKKTDYTAAPEDTNQAIADADKKAQDAANSANNALKQGQVVINSTFSNWTQAFPAGLGSWTSSTVSKETTLTRTGNAMRFDVPTDTAQIGAQITTGYFIPNLPNNKYYVVELDFMLVSGSITGACVLLDWNSMSPSRASIHLSDVVPAPTLGKWYTVRAVMKRPTDNLSGYSAMGGYLLANYSGSTTNKVKNIVFDRLAFREPTQQEIDAYEITTIENGVTVIDGGKLKTNSVKAESVDARRLRVTNNSGTVTLEITNTGEVTVNGKVYINSSTMFADGFDPSITDGGRNVVLNSRFSTADATSWTNWGSPSVRQVEDITDLPGFDKAVKFTTTGANQGLYQTISVENGKKYTASCYVKSSSGQAVLQVNDGALGYPGATMDAGDAAKNKWVKLYFTFTAKANTIQIYIGRSGAGTNGTYWFTGVKLEEGSKLTAWNPAGEDVDGLIGKVVTPNGDIKSLDIASSMAITPGAIDVVSKNINLKGKVTFSDFASGWALDSKGNKISNSDQPGYDPAKPLYLDMDGNYRPLSDEKNFMSNLFAKDDTTGVTVIDGNYIKTGTIQAKYANFRDVQVYNDAGQQTFRIDTNGNLSTSGTSQSIGYERQKKGWKIDADGSAEFNAATFRGDIELGYYNAPTDAFVVTGGLLSGVGGTGKDLRFWAGSNKSTAPFKVFSDGTLEATKGFFTGTFSGEVVVGNILIKDTATKGDAKIILTDDSKIQKVVLGESAVELNTKTTFGNFLTVDITNQKLDFGANDFGIDYKNNTIKMKSFSIKGTTALEFISDGSSGDDFVFKNVTGDTSVRVDGSFIARDDIEITNVLRMKKSVDAGNKGIDYVFI